MKLNIALLGTFIFAMSVQAKTVSEIELPGNARACIFSLSSHINASIGTRVRISCDDTETKEILLAYSGLDEVELRRAELIGKFLAATFKYKDCTLVNHDTNSKLWVCDFIRS